MEYLINGGAILAGLTLLVYGGDMLVKGAVAIALKYNISTIVIGLTIVALGTSAPEIVVSISAALDNHPDIAIGNVVGSNISNILLVLGLSAIISAVMVDKRASYKDLPFLVILTSIFIAMGHDDGMISRADAAILLLLFVLFTFYTLKSDRAVENSPDEKDVVEQEISDEVDIEEAQKISMKKAALLVLISIALLAAGAELLVSGAVAIAKIWGISEAVIGLTIVAVGSSAPELVTCVVAAYHKHSDLISGNVIGSNMLNITLGVGIAGLVQPLQVGQQFLVMDNWVMLGATLALCVAVWTTKKVNRVMGIGLIAGYVSFIVAQF